jgi:hypothetical protein
LDWRAAWVVKEMEQVARRPCPKIDVEHELERSPPSLTAVSRLVHEQTNLLVGRSCEPALLAERARRADDRGDAPRAWFDASNETDDTDVCSRRRDNHPAIVAPDRCRNSDVSATSA